MTAQAANHVYRSWMERWHIQQRFPRVDWSIVDLWLARKLLAMHISHIPCTLSSPSFRCFSICW
jgi:hypothetical protein